MNETWTWLLGWGIAGLCILLAYRRGFHVGTRTERLRCAHLALQAFEKRWSPTLRWVLNGISEGRDNLAPAEEFLDEEDTERKQKAKEITDLIAARDAKKKDLLTKQSALDHEATRALIDHYEELMRRELGL